MLVDTDIDIYKNKSDHRNNPHGSAAARLARLVGDCDCLRIVPDEAPLSGRALAIIELTGITLAACHDDAMLLRSFSTWPAWSYRLGRSFHFEALSNICASLQLP